MRVRIDQRIGVEHLQLVIVLCGQLLQIDLVNDTGARWYDLKVLEGLAVPNTHLSSELTETILPSLCSLSLDSLITLSSLMVCAKLQSDPCDSRPSESVHPRGPQLMEEQPCIFQKVDKIG